MGKTATSELAYLGPPATIHFSTENILTETKKGPLFEPKFIFFKRFNKIFKRLS